MVAIAQEEVEGEIVVSVESEFEEAKGKRTQKEEDVGPRESLSKGFRPCWSAYFGVSRVIAPSAERVRVGESTSASWAPGH